MTSNSGDMRPSASTPAIRVAHATKRYGDTVAVDDLSFEVRRGEVFGLLGPNGAGKTTTIRMILGLIQSSAGAISVLGEAISAPLRRRIGYLPEERGLYQDVKLIDGLVYLATLKGVPRSVARRRALDGLETLELGHAANKPVRALSRGMQQKAQFLATVLHEPELLIIDEPFAGLDPVNTRALRDMLLRLRTSGTTIVMSAHQMHRVEELCQRLLVLQGGSAVLYGALDEIRRLFAADSVFVEADGDLADLPGVERVVPRGATTELELAKGVTPADLLKALAARPEIDLRRYEVHSPSLEEIFLIVAGRRPRGPGDAH